MQLKDRHIMVIDDDDDDRKLFCRALGQVSEDIGCLRASNGIEALEYLFTAENSVPDLIFLDINMPVMSGWEFLMKIKKEIRLSNIPVIVFSTSSNPRDVNIAYDLGALTYCTKPDDPVDLRNMLSFVSNHLDKGLGTSVMSADGRSYFQYPPGHTTLKH